MSVSSDESPTQTRSLQRSATLPPKLNPLKQREQRELDSSDPPNGGLIYFHPSVKIVHFSPRAIAPIPSSLPDFDYPVDTIGTLPWRSATERTVALAPLRLEKLYGVTVFLKCGNVVHAILKNSQCWCVDNASTFVLRIGPLKYYRIELPLKTDEDRTYVARLNGALPTILRYEITPCPFKREFTVELPKEAVVPKRKKAWRPRERRESAPVYPSFIPELRCDRKEEVLDRPKTAGNNNGNAAADFGTPRTKSGSRTPLETIPDDAESVPPVPPVDITKVYESLKEHAKHAKTEPKQDFNTKLEMFEAKPKADLDLLSPRSTEQIHSLRSTPRPKSSPYPVSGVDEAPGSLEEKQEDKQETLQSDHDEASAEPEIPESSVTVPVVEAPAQQEELHSEPRHDSSEATTAEQKTMSTPNMIDEPEVSQPHRELRKQKVKQESPQSDQNEVSSESEIPQASIPVVEEPTQQQDEFHDESSSCITSSEFTITEATMTEPPMVIQKAKSPTAPEYIDGSQNNRENLTNVTSSQSALEDKPITASEVDSEPTARHAPSLSVLEQESPESLLTTRENLLRDNSPNLTASESKLSTARKNNDKPTTPHAPSSSLPEQQTPETPEITYESLLRENSPSPTALEHTMPGSLLNIPSSSDTFQSIRKESATNSNSNSNSDSDRSNITRGFRRRSRQSRMREMSPMPPPSSPSLNSQNSQRQHRSARKATSSFFRKTCTLVLVPPVQLFLVLIHMAAQIVVKPEGNVARPDHEDDYNVPVTPDNNESNKAKRPA